MQILEHLDLVLGRRKVVHATQALNIGVLNIATDHHLVLLLLLRLHVVVILRLHNILVALGGALLLRSLLLPPVVRIIYLAVGSRLLALVLMRAVNIVLRDDGCYGRVLVVAGGAVFLALEVGLVGLHVGGDVVRLQVVLIFHDEHVVIGYQVVRLVRYRVIQLVVEVVVARVILLG